MTPSNLFGSTEHYHLVLIRILAINHAVKRNFENCWDVQGTSYPPDFD